MKALVLAETGWASFLSHDGTRCARSCGTCRYWCSIWADDAVRKERLRENLERIVSFRSAFAQTDPLLPALKEALPELLSKLYSDCQAFAESEINLLLERFELVSRSKA